MKRRPARQLLTSGELAIMSGISKRSIVKAVAAGRIKAARTFGGHYRISLTEARRFLRGRNLDTTELDVRENCVLVIAGARFVAELLSDVLGQAGVQVLHTESLFEAGALAQSHHPWLTILDAAAALPDPFTVCRGIASCDCNRQSSLIVLAGPGPFDADRFRASGARMVLGKPFSVKQLKDMLRELGCSTGAFRRIER
jgi:excisionase family DNA binding protein